MDFQAFLNQLVNDIKPLAPANVDVFAHDGPFDLEELKRYGANAPCWALAIAASEDSGNNGAPIDNVHIGCAIITKASGNQPGGLPGTQSAGSVNLFLGTYLKTRLWSVAVGGEEGFGGPDAGRPLQLTYRNLYDSEQARAGICLGTVTWVQSLQLPVVDPGVPVPFLESFTTYGLLSPPGGPTVTNQLKLPGPTP